MGWNTDILDDQNVSAYAKLIYFALSKFVNKQGQCFPSISRLAEATNLANRTVKNYIPELIEKGWIKKEQRKKEGGSWENNLYTLHRLTLVHDMPKVEKFRPKRLGMTCLRVGHDMPKVGNHKSDGVVHDMPKGRARHAPPLVHHVPTNLSNITYNNILCDQNEKLDNTEIENKKRDKPKTTTKKFIIPTVEEIRMYCQENQFEINADQFFDYYESKGWVVGKSKMKNWKASVRTWARNNKKFNPDKTDNSISKVMSNMV